MWSSRRVEPTGVPGLDDGALGCDRALRWDRVGAVRRGVGVEKDLKRVWSTLRHPRCELMDSAPLCVGRVLRW